MDQLAAATAKARGVDRTLLIGIGAQKAGTTWLSKYFQKHPQVMMSPIKELHYFDVALLPDLCGKHQERKLHQLKRLAEGLTIETVRLHPRLVDRISGLVDRLRMVDGDQYYLEYFLSRVQSEKIMCEITPSYSMLDRKGFGRMAALHPDVKFVFLMRNPIERFWSQLRFHRRRQPDFDIARAVKASLSDPHYVLRSDYRRTLTELFAAVDPSQIHIEFYENLFSHQAIRRLCAFLGIRFSGGQYEARANASPGRDLPAAERKAMYSGLADAYGYVGDVFPAELPESWKHDMATLS